MKKTLLFILILLTFNVSRAAFTKTNNSHLAAEKVYSFNFGNIQLKNCLLNRKRGDHRKFQGVVVNRGSADLEWVEFEFYFRDPDFNHGRYSLISREVIKSIPGKSHKNFKLKIPVGDIDGRDFKIKMTTYKERGE